MTETPRMRLLLTEAQVGAMEVWLSSLPAEQWKSVHANLRALCDDWRTHHQRIGELEDELAERKPKRRKRLWRWQVMQDEIIPTVAVLRGRNEQLKAALRVAAQLVDALNGVDLHETAYEKFVERTGDVDCEQSEPNDDDYAEAFVAAALLADHPAEER